MFCFCEEKHSHTATHHPVVKPPGSGLTPKDRRQGANCIAPAGLPEGGKVPYCTSYATYPLHNSHYLGFDSGRPQVVTGTVRHFFSTYRRGQRG